MILNMNELVLLNEESVTEQFDTHRRYKLQKASSEELLEFKLELVETLGLLEIHSKPNNRVTYWYVQKLAGLLTITEDVILQRIKLWQD